MKRLSNLTQLLTVLVLAAFPDVGAHAQAADTVDRFFEAYRTGHVEPMLRVYAEDAVFEDVAQRHRYAGREELAAFLGQLTAVHLEMDVREKNRLTRDDTVVVEFEYVGVLSGEALSQLTGREGCSDQEYAIPATSWFRIEDGRIASQRDFIDLASLQELQARLTQGTH